ADAILDEMDVRMLQDATELCLTVDPDYKQDPAPRIVVGMPPGTLGMCRAGEVLISHATFAMGLESLAGTLYEEYLHRHRGLKDNTRSLQNHIINALMRLARRV